MGRVLESMSSAFFQLDRQWRFAYVNSEAERLLGQGRASLLGESMWEAFPASVGSTFETHYRQAVGSGGPVSFEAHYPVPLDAWYEIRAWPSPSTIGARSSLQTTLKSTGKPRKVAATWAGRRAPNRKSGKPCVWIPKLRKRFRNWRLSWRPLTPTR